MKNLSGGQKVKCVIGASMWFCPHIVVLDEPTNYLDRDSLGALSRAIKEFQGGVLMISHNAEFFGDIAPEVWEVPGDQKVHVSGAEWMEAVKAKELADARAKKKSIPKQDDDKFDALGNKIETAVAAADIDRDYVPRPRPLYLQLRGAMDSVSDFESGGCGFESRRSCRRSRGASARRRRRECVSTVRSPRRSLYYIRRRRGRTRLDLDAATRWGRTTTRGRRCS